MIKSTTRSDIEVVGDGLLSVSRYTNIYNSNRTVDFGIGDIVTIRHYVGYDLTAEIIDILAYGRVKIFITGPKGNQHVGHATWTEPHCVYEVIQTAEEIAEELIS